jgi:hypothetical protein
MQRPANASSAWTSALGGRSEKPCDFGMLAANHLPPPDETSSSNPEGDNVHPCCSIQLLPLRMSAGATSGNAGEDIAFGQEMPKPLVPKGFGNACQRPQDVS